MKRRSAGVTRSPMVEALLKELRRRPLNMEVLTDLVSRTVERVGSWQILTDMLGEEVAKLPPSIRYEYGDGGVGG